MIKDKLAGVRGFERDRVNIEHIAEHNVIPEEAEQVFFDTNQVLDEDIKHSVTEKRLLIIGKTKEGRLLYQIFTIRGNKIRVISSRDINKREFPLYPKG